MFDSHHTSEHPTSEHPTINEHHASTSTVCSPAPPKTSAARGSQPCQTGAETPSSSTSGSTGAGYTLRDFQRSAVDRLRAAVVSGTKRNVLVAPTGSGKTVMASAIVMSAVEKGKRIYFLAHRRELIDQASDKLSENGVAHGVIMAGHWRNAPEKPVQVCSVQTLIRRMQHLDDPPDILIVDECHRSTAASYRKIIESCPRAVLIGLTATPERADGTGLGEIYDGMVSAASIDELLEHDPPYLVPPRVFAPSTPNLTKVHIKRGDYDVRELADEMDRGKLIGDIVEHWRKLASERQTVVFGVQIAHSEHIRDMFVQAGVRAEHVDGKMTNADRAAVLDRWKTGETQVVTNCDVLSEGFDYPAASCCILARPTRSVGGYLQRVGRVLRPYPGKTDALILDHAGNVYEHGFPQTERDWSLNGRDKGTRATAPSVTTCPECLCAFDSAARRTCPECGWEMPVQVREIEHDEDGKLEELNIKDFKRAKKREQGLANSLEALIAIGRKRGYHSPEKWAGYVWAARKSRA